jgi:hypothetical protein
LPNNSQERRSIPRIVLEYRALRHRVEWLGRETSVFLLGRKREVQLCSALA